MKKSITDKIETLKKEKAADNIDSIKKATSELSTEVQKIGQHMNQQGPQAAGAL